MTTWLQHGTSCERVQIEHVSGARHRAALGRSRFACWRARRRGGAPSTGSRSCAAKPGHGLLMRRWLRCQVAGAGAGHRESAPERTDRPALHRHSELSKDVRHLDCSAIRNSWYAASCRQSAAPLRAPMAAQVPRQAHGGTLFSRNWRIAPGCSPICGAFAPSYLSTGARPDCGRRASRRGDHSRPARGGDSARFARRTPRRWWLGCLLAED